MVKTSLAAFLIRRVRSPREENSGTVSMLELKQKVLNNVSDVQASELELSLQESQD